MNKHTPGPWYVDTEHPIQVVKHMEHLVGTSRCTEYVVADIYADAFMGEEELANARLISAAPEMYALLLQIHTELSNTARADPDPENWEGYTLHRIEKLLWPEGSK